MKADKAQKETSKAKTKNPVAKHARSFNKAQVHTDRKKAAKRGHIKHKLNPSTQSDIKATKKTT